MAKRVEYIKGGFNPRAREGATRPVACDEPGACFNPRAREGAT